jgi:predicted cupin superfamily sugar epimerase
VNSTSSPVQLQVIEVCLRERSANIGQKSLEIMARGAGISLNQVSPSASIQKTCSRGPLMVYSASMKRPPARLLITFLALASLATLQGSPPAGSDARARELIELLHLSLLPKESGYLGLIGESAQKVQIDGRPLAVQSQVYYLLTRDRPINYLHWLAPDDTHILIEGGPVDYFIFHPDGHAEKIVLGRDVAAGERPVVAVPGGCWKALRLHESAQYALMANALSPEFTSDRVRIGEGAAWVGRFSGTTPWATPEKLRALIGPNWIR